ncbi:unnamed protein product [Haemonchus placei]|uniref:Secreted protein n=1 Tax=Haemonchus placei TaxID=6290 RepID=A0A0N4WVL5_HAEPC|nr:unnamed protein product [Haemonchus placei]
MFADVILLYFFFWISGYEDLPLFPKSFESKVCAVGSVVSRRVTFIFVQKVVIRVLRDLGFVDVFTFGFRELCEAVALWFKSVGEQYRTPWKICGRIETTLICAGC